MRTLHQRGDCYCIHTGHRRHHQPGKALLDKTPTAYCSRYHSGDWRCKCTQRFLIFCSHFVQAVAGLAYEFVGRPWDSARRAVEIHRLEASHPTQPPWPILVNKFREEGVRGFFRNPAPNEHADGMSSAARRRIYTVLRTIGRVGPWGMGFLVWEMYSM